MKKLNELEDTLEKQEKKELIFKICFNSLPFLFLIVVFLLVIVFKW